MGPWALMLLAAAPVSFNTLVRQSDHVVVARVVAVTRTPRPSSTLAVEVTLKGLPARTLETTDALIIGTRGLFFVGKGPTRALWLGSDDPGLFHFSQWELSLEGPAEGRATTAAVFAALGKPDLVVPPERGFRVVDTTCAPCTFEATDRLRPANAIDCGELRSPTSEACVVDAWKRGVPVVVRAAWSGIDSGGRVLFVGTREHLQRAWLDDDVTGGTHPQCSAAVFAERCLDPRWAGAVGDRALECGRVTALPTLCHERESRNEVLGPRLPLEELPTPRFDSFSGAAAVCGRHRDGTLSCNASW